ncbi:uncharacterized protein N7511_009548 [Penicillium nucicola]|uniref:uncharacterized protein n=1 Tax=Penicillium nucicola TaxID=1850975 RepID=UPI002545980B|nr:uncharacterized protein N7511_009548 [Penicillium nucicola]KAJ5747852.1 hypothetical protein N7511_009548 [Penicillium nucicola]
MLDFLRKAFQKAPAKLYGLDHAVLNIQLPPQSMWMNIGYWEVHTNDFPTACEALLEQVVTTALSKEKASSIQILDVGCGCGDQSLYLFKTLRASPTPESSQPPDPQTSEQSLRRRQSGSRTETEHQPPPPFPTLKSYIGITLEQTQARYGSNRLHDLQHQTPDRNIQAEIFCSDAGTPNCWTGDLKQSINTLETALPAPTSSTWLLALDTMYHFRPTRLPLLTYARTNLNANLMAFDLIIADDIPWHQKLLLRVLCWLTNTPFGNLVSRSDYVDMLVLAGYDRSQIEIRDVTKFCFRGLADFIQRRVEEGVPFGLKMGKFNVARRMFAWWARGDIVRGVIVVARGGKSEE